MEADADEELWSAGPGAEAEQLVWSTDGGVLLVVTAGERHPIGDVRREFDPGTVGAPAFPRIVEWCCPAP